MVEGMNATSIKNRRAGGAPPCDDPRDRNEIFLDYKDRESFLERLASVAKVLGVSPSAVSKSIVRGQHALGNEDIEEYLLESQ